MAKIFLGPPQACKNRSENVVRPVPFGAAPRHHLLGVCESCLGDVTTFALGELGWGRVSGAVLCLEASKNLA